MPSFLTRRFVIGSSALLAAVAVFLVFFYALRPADAAGASAPVVFEVQQGEGFVEIMRGLGGAGLVRSAFATEVFAGFTGRAFRIQPGLYRLNAAMSAPEIIDALAQGSGREVSVTVPEGMNLYQIDTLLSAALVIRSGELENYPGAGSIEGKLFPDTYRFFVGSDVKDVIKRMTDTFAEKAAPLLAADKKNIDADLTLASIVDKEVPDPVEQQIVAGILKKRLAAGMPLQVDASVCYAKLMAHPDSGTGCYPLSSLDFKLDSPYNTYLYKGLPPGPIGNPGISAISAVLHPKSSPYWFYLSDPRTGKTIFAKTLDEQTQNKVKYLDSH